jgi:hypothetical protein
MADADFTSALLKLADPLPFMDFFIQWRHKPRRQIAPSNMQLPLASIRNHGLDPELLIGSPHLLGFVKRFDFTQYLQLRAPKAAGQIMGVPAPP